MDRLCTPCQPSGLCLAMATASPLHSSHDRYRQTTSLRLWSVCHPPPNQEQGDANFALERVVLPFSALAGWGIVAVGVLTSLHALGVNIQPLLTVGGVGGLAVGFGAQSVTANGMAGINLVRALPPSSVELGLQRAKPKPEPGLLMKNFLCALRQLFFFACVRAR